MNKRETGKLLSMLQAVWSNENITPETIEVWYWILGDYEFEQLMGAAKVYIGQGKFFPKPAELIELAKAEQPSLDAKLYRQYADLRRQFQAGQLGKRQSSELIRIERKLGLPTGGDRPVPLREIAS